MLKNLIFQSDVDIIVNVKIIYEIINREGFISEQPQNTAKNVFSVAQVNYYS